jgi:hypothetical protein
MGNRKIKLIGIDIRRFRVQRWMGLVTVPADLTEAELSAIVSEVIENLDNNGEYDDEHSTADWKERPSREIGATQPAFRVRRVYSQLEMEDADGSNVIVIGPVDVAHDGTGAQQCEG